VIADPPVEVGAVHETEAWAFPRVAVTPVGAPGTAAGTTAFAKNYLHVDWDGSETQNDKATTNVHGVATSLTDGIGAVPLDHSVLGFAFEDQITPNDGANKIFTDDAGAADALSFSGAYKVVFLAFPLEAYGTAGQKADLVVRVLTFFGS